MIIVLGRIFPSCFFVAGPRPQGNEMTPDHIGQGSFQFLGFNHWVTSLSAGSTGLFWFGWNPFRSIHVLQLTIAIAIGIYVKRKILKAQPAGVLTIFGITFFVPSVYHTLRAFTRRETIQISSVQMV